ncbi:MAG: ABC transporter substrate-binding protein [Candidatus Aenigmarchaeota archaeon]|nr:ABC transporter substrate-binding protein [Candidatus Aenigmarchaeota archaeon]
MKKVFLLPCLGILIILFFSGCVTNPQKEETVTRTEPEILVMGSAVDIYTIDPAVGFDEAISSTLKSLYDSLYRHVDDPPRVIPWLAEGFDVSEDGREWIFYLRKDAKFHDGSPVTAEDVVYSAKRLMRIGKGAASLFKGIIDENSVVAVDNYTVKFVLSKPFAPFLDIIPWLFVVNSKLVKAHEGNDYGQTWLETHEAGSGPFTIKKWVPGEVYEFEAVKDYWRGWPDEGRLAGYVRKVMREASERKKALEKGEIHLADWMSAEDQLVLRDVNGMVLTDESAINTYEIKMNNKKGYTSNIHVRKAISYAFDYEALENIWAGRAKLLRGPLPAGSEWVNRNLNVYRLDLEKAREELSKSPWPNGGFELDYVYVTGLEEERQTGLILKDQLSKLNITVNIIPMSWTDAVALFANPDTSPDLFPLYSSSAYPDPDNYLWSAYHSSQAGKWTNPGYYENPELDLLLEEARGRIDIEKRKELYNRAQEIIVEDAVNIFGVSPPDFHVWSPKVKGLDYCPVQGSDEDFYWLRIEE